MKSKSNSGIPGRPLVLPILSRFDNWLLKNYPDIWSTRAHLLLYFLLLGDALLFLLCWAIPDDPRSESEVGYWVVSASLLAIIGMIFWLVFMFRFNVFKRYGNLAKGDRLRTFFVFLFLFIALTCTAYIPFVAEKIKADALYSDEEVVQDINDINTYIGRLERDSIELMMYSDTIIYTGSALRAQQLNSMFTRPSVYSVESGHTSYSYMDTATARYQRAEADSIEYLSDTGMVLTTIHDFRFWQDESSDLKPLTKLQLYYRIFRSQASEGEDWRRLKSLLAKYTYSAEEYGYNTYMYDMQYYYGNDQDRITVKYGLGPVRSAIYSIIERKHRLSERDLKEGSLFTVYFSLALTLLLFSFRHSTTKTFFISILAGIIIGILTGLAGVIFRWNELGALQTLLLYYVVFITLAATIKVSPKRSLVKGIVLNFTLWMTFAVPLLMLGVYHAWVRKLYDYDVYHIDYGEKNYQYVWAQVAGGVLLVLMVAFVFSRWYRTWYAQPEE
jgi:hypothetical protein